jgi:hypothetical protein
MVLFASACLLGARFQRPAIDQREVHMAQVISAQVTLSATSSHEIFKHKSHVSQWGLGSDPPAKAEGRSVYRRLHFQKQHQSLTSSSAW